MKTKVYDQEIPEESECWYDSRELTAKCLLVKSTHSAGMFTATLRVIEVVMSTDLAKHYKAGDIFEVSKHDDCPHLAGWTIKAEIIDSVG